MIKKISKSRFMEGQNCTLALWFNTHRNQQVMTGNPDPMAAAKARGHEIGALAQTYFPGGVAVKAGPMQLAAAIRETQSYIKQGEAVIFEAAAMHPQTGANARLDALRRVPGTGEWDMIEVKSSRNIHPGHIDDLAFQYGVFTAAGYKIRNAYLMMIDEAYVRHGDLDVQKFFTLHDVTPLVIGQQQFVNDNVKRLIPIMAADTGKPDEALGQRCSKPYPCAHKATCWKDVPLYSVFNAASDAVAAQVFKATGGYDVKDLPASTVIKPDKRIEVDSHLSGKVHSDPQKLQGFLNRIEYPLHYLDYETVASAVPLYDGTKSGQQVPFQFSLHVEPQAGGKLEHTGFIHRQRDDPRRKFTEALIAACGDKGSVLVYSQSFEESRNKELAQAFPEYAAALTAINKRMVDLYEPFKNRWLYHPDQKGSASIKAVLPSFTPLSYKDLNINNGEQALNAYLAFKNLEITGPKAEEKLFDDLDVYCKLDTYAMVEILRVIRDYAAPKAPLPAPAP